MVTYWRNLWPEILEEVVDGVLYIEEWRPIEELGGEYEVSSFGRFRESKNISNIKKQSLNTYGYACVYLYSKINKHRFSGGSHILVARSFIDNPKNKREGNHLRGVKDDNRVRSLEWVTPSENVRHSFEIGLHRRPIGELNCRALLTESQVMEIFNSKSRGTVLSKKYKVSTTSIMDIRIGRAWTYLTGKKWETSRISEETVIKIFQSKGRCKDIGKDNGVSAMTVCRIKNGKQWPEITSKIKVV